MTIDFVKVRIVEQALIQEIKANPHLVWNSKTEKLSHFDFEQVQTKETRLYKGILFCFHSDKLEILFRPHYFFNNNEHNANDFPVKKCIEVLRKLVEVLELENLEPLQVVNLEYGINLIVPVPIENLITFIEYHNRNEFKRDTGLIYSKKSYTSTRRGTANTYKIIKAYAKCLQFPDHTPKNTFRFEVKSKKSLYINKLGINSYNDLLEPETYNRLGEELIKEFEAVLILDNETTFANLNPKEKRTLKEYLNTHTWYRILQKYRNGFNYHKEKYFTLLNKTGTNIHTLIKTLLREKVEVLKFSADLPTLQKNKISADLPVYIGEICTKTVKDHTRVKVNEDDERKCPVTGMPIHMQKEQSFLLSNTGLKHLEENDPAQFEFLKRTLLTGNHNEYEKTIYSRISKQIRNRYNNKPHQYQENQTLFS